jgi:hypothetical protein
MEYGGYFMSLGVGAGVGKTAPVGEDATTLDFITYGMNGSEVALGVGTVGAQAEAIWTSDERSDDYENHIAPEDGTLETFYINVYTNTLDGTINVYLSESSIRSGFLDHQNGTYSASILTIPAGITGVFSATGLGIPMTKGKHYCIVFDDGTATTGLIGHHQSYRMEFGTNPEEPTKFVKMGRELEIGSSDTARQFNFNRIIKTGGAVAWSIPMPFAGTMSSLTVGKNAVPTTGAGDPWEIKVYKNASVVWTGNMTKDVNVVDVFNPAVDFVAGDTFAFEIDKQIAFGHASFTNIAAGWDIA